MELSVRECQGSLCIDMLLACNIDKREEDVVNLFEGTLGAGWLCLELPTSSWTLSQTSDVVCQSKPTLAVRFEIFWACMRAGSEMGTESRSPGSSPDFLPFEIRSSRFTWSQMSGTSATSV